MAGIVGSKAARASGGTVSTVGPYTVHAFTTTGANTFTPATTGFVDILLVGGGGNSGASASPGFNGGGGAGATLFKKMIPVTAGTPYPISVGVAGANTTFIYSGITTTAYAGGVGGTYAGGPAGNSPNASGGGGDFINGGFGSGAGVYGIGYPGGLGGSSAGGGGGGGAGGAGNPGVSPGPLQCLGGPGVPITYFTGISTDIASVGGPGGGAPIPLRITSPSYGSGGVPIQNSPYLGPGVQGVAYIRYI